MANARYLQAGKTPFLFLACWIVYYAANLGRLGYTAAMAEIIRAEGFSNQACGLVATGFFVSYGAGQIVSGFVGDRLSPKWMVLAGVGVSAAANVALGLADNPRTMLAVWCVNGASQSMIWSPILRIFAEYFHPRFRRQACVKISLTYPAGVLSAYGLGALLIHLSGWRTVFFAIAGVMACAALFWVAGVSWAEHFLTDIPEGAPPETEGMPVGADASSHPPRPRKALLLIALALLLQGMLRDGVMSWLPVYLSASFGVSSSASILASMVLPVVNLSGAYVVNLLTRKLHRDELSASLMFFLAAGVAQLLILLLGQRSMALSLAAFAVTASSMMGINMLLVSFVPTYFVRWGNVSAISGLLNAAVYAGSSIATYAIGAILDRFSWNILLGVLTATALAGVVVSLLGKPAWRQFLTTDGAQL